MAALPRFEFFAIGPVPGRVNQQWSLDFMADQLATGQRIRILTVLDHFIRECVWVEVADHLPADAVTAAITGAIAQRRKSAVLTLDNGTEFTTSTSSAAWLRLGTSLRGGATSTTKRDRTPA